MKPAPPAPRIAAAPPDSNAPRANAWKARTVGMTSVVRMRTASHVQRTAELVVETVPAWVATARTAVHVQQTVGAIRDLSATMGAAWMKSALRLAAEKSADRTVAAVLAVSAGRVRPVQTVPAFAIPTVRERSAGTTGVEVCAVHARKDLVARMASAAIRPSSTSTISQPSPTS